MFPFVLLVVILIMILFYKFNKIVELLRKILKLLICDSVIICLKSIILTYHYVCKTLSMHTLGNANLKILERGFDSNFTTYKFLYISIIFYIILYVYSSQTFQNLCVLYQKIIISIFYSETSF